MSDVEGLAGAAPWLTLALTALNVLQVVALAYIADRSRRVRGSDRRKARHPKRPT